MDGRLTLPIPDKVSNYIKEYQKRHGIGRKEIAALVGMSVSSIVRIEETSEGVALKNLIPIALLEHDSLSSFFKSLEGKKKAAPSKTESSNQQIHRLIHTVEKDEFTEFLKLADTVDEEKPIGHRFAWTIRLMNYILKGTGPQLIEIETNLLNYYLSNIEEKNKKARARISRLFRHRFKF